LLLINAVKTIQNNRSLNVMGIATATQELVTAAAYAQQERVKHGLGKKKDGEPYVRDPKWTEGLISAGKSVAEATRELIAFANKAAQGTIDDAALIAASRVLSASTATLRQATHSKSAPGSKSALSIDSASSEVNRATGVLVSVAQKVQDLEPETKKPGLTGNANMYDQQATVARLETEVEDRRKKLHEFRKENYVTKKTGGISPRNNPVTPQPPPVYANATIDSSSINPFGSNSNEADTKVPSYQSRLDATLNRNMNISFSTQPPTQGQTPGYGQIPFQQPQQVQQSQHNPFL